MSTILVNANIYVERGNFQEAMLIENGIIKAVGTNAEIRAMAPAGCEEIDAEGRTVIPGFNDSHQHLYNVGESLRMIKLHEVPSLAEMIERGRRFIEENHVAPGEIVLGRGWNQDFFTDTDRMPTREDLDKISTEHPIICTRACGHVAVCNSMALEKAGIDRNTPQPAGASIDLDANGDPNGIVRESGALAMVLSIIPQKTVADYEKSIRTAMDYAESMGVTSVQTNDIKDKNYAEMWQAYENVTHAGRSVRAYHQCCFTQIDNFRAFLADGYKTGHGDDLNRVGPLKLFVDGSLGARTAKLNAPYADDPTTTGITVMDQAYLDEICGIAAANGMSVATHAIGDKAAEMILEAYEKNMTDSANPLRNGVIHCQITTPETLERFKKNNILAQVQPIFIHYDKNIVYDRVGEELAKTSYAFKTLADMGVHVSYGTDSPVEDMNPYNNLYCAVTRMSLTGEGEPYLPEQGVDIYDAVDNYTKESAFVSFDENKKGRLMPGYLADLVILDRNIFEVPSMEIKDVRPVATMIGGEIVYRA